MFWEWEFTEVDLLNSNENQSLDMLGKELDL